MKTCQKKFNIFPLKRRKDITSKEIFFHNLILQVISDLFGQSFRSRFKTEQLC